MVRIIHIVAALLVCATSLFAQAPPDPEPAIEALGQVAFLEGDWSGEGWIQMGRGPKEEFTQTENVEMGFLSAQRWVGPVLDRG